MKFFKIGLIFSSFALFALACSQTAPTANNSATVVNKTPTAPANSVLPANTPATSIVEFAEARRIYDASCANCHKADGAGGEKIMENGDKIRVPNYKSPGALKASDEKFYDIIANGADDEMPAFKGKLSEAQMRELVQFIRKEFQGK